MKLHILKIRPCYFYYVHEGFKNFEIRKDDRGYEVGDLIHFVNVSGEDYTYATNNVFQITYILRDALEFGLNKDYCILSLKKLGDNINE